MQANHNEPTNKHKQKRKDDPQIPQPDLRFVKAKSSKPDTEKGPEPKQHPPTRFAKGHSGLTTVSVSKTCENELSTTTFKHTRRPSPEAYPLKCRCAKAVHKPGAANYASLSVLSDQLVQKAFHGLNRYHRLNVSKEVVVVTVPGTPQWGDGQ